MPKQDAVRSTHHLNHKFLNSTHHQQHKHNGNKMQLQHDREGGEGVPKHACIVQKDKCR